MKIQFQTLLPWATEILGTIKKDIKSEYLPENQAFCRKLFGNLPLSRITTEEIAAAFTKELVAGDEELLDWVINRWVFKHGDIYQHFADRLFEINPDFDQLKELSQDESAKVLAGTKESFGSKNTYFFSILNGVVFPEAVLAQLRKNAEEQTQQQQADLQEKELEKVIDRLQKEMEQMAKKHEQSLAGVMKKYTFDVKALKKQILALQHG